jgi:hypothetical protein
LLEFFGEAVGTLGTLNASEKAAAVGTRGTTTNCSRPRLLLF